MARKSAEADKDTLSGLRDREYATTKVKNEDGKTKIARGNGDAVARALIGLDAKALEKVVKDNDLLDKHKGRATSATNLGLARMSIGNSLRAKVKRGEHVQIGEHLVKKLDQRIVVPGEMKDKPARAVKDKEAA